MTGSCECAACVDRRARDAAETARLRAEWQATLATMRRMTP